MTERQERLEKLRQNRKNVSFKDLRLVLEDCGFELVRSSGSHHSFSVMIDGESRTLVVPHRHPIKPYVREALKLIDHILAEQIESETDEEDIEEETDED